MNKLTKEKYDSVPHSIKYSLLNAIIWADVELTDFEGGGHDFQLDGRDGQLCCCFAKPEWKADHCGEYMDTASEAVAMAVCEYLSGV